jgi:hypothetical protein
VKASVAITIDERTMLSATSSKLRSFGGQLATPRMSADCERCREIVRKSLNAVRSCLSNHLARDL